MAPGLLNPITSTAARLKGVYYGWWVVAIAFATNALVMGVYYVGFSVFFLPFSRDLKVNRTAASLPFSLARVISVVTSPLAGLAADRFGPAKLLFIGGLVAGLGYVLLSRSSGYIMFLLVFVLIITPGIHGGTGTPGLVAVSRWFRRRRGMAFAIASTGFAVGGAAIVPLLALAVQNLGWRNAALAVGILIWALVLPASFLLRRSPDGDSHLAGETQKVDGAGQGTVRGATQAASSSNSQDFSFRGAIRTRTYWFLAVSFGLRGAVWSAISVHLVAIMVWKSLEESTAGLLLGAYPLFWIPTTLAMGWLADLWPKHRIAGYCALIAALGLVLLVTWDRAEVWQILLIFALLAPNDGSWPLAWAMLSDEFGRRDFGTLRGGVLSMESFLGIGGPIYAGWVFETTQSYFWVALPGAALLVTAGLLNLLMPHVRLGSPESASEARQISTDPQNERTG